MDNNYNDYRYTPERIGDFRPSERTEASIISKTYSLLAASFLPMLAGVATSYYFFPTLIRMFSGSAAVTLLLLLGVFYAMCYMVEKNRHNPAGVAWLFAFCFVMGTYAGLVAVAVAMTSGLKVVLTALAMATGAFASMAAVGHIAKFNSARLNGFVTAGVIVVMIGVVANIFLQIPVLMLTISGMVVILSCVMIAWQVRRMVEGGEDSHVSCTLSLFISFINLFLSILNILSAFSGRN